jgi:hypothetical protein
VSAPRVESPLETLVRLFGLALECAHVSDVGGWCIDCGAYRRGDRWMLPNVLQGAKQAIAGKPMDVVAALERAGHLAVATGAPGARRPGCICGAAILETVLAPGERHLSFCPAAPRAARDGA